MGEREADHAAEHDPQLPGGAAAYPGLVVAVLAAVLDLGAVGRQRLRCEESLDPDLAVVLAVLQPKLGQDVVGGVRSDAGDRRVDPVGEPTAHRPHRTALRLVLDPNRTDAPVDIAYLDPGGPRPVGLLLEADLAVATARNPDLRHG